MKKITYLCAVTAALLASVQLSAQNISFRGGASRLLYDGRYFPELYGEGVSPIVPSFDLKLGWTGDPGSPWDRACKGPEYGIAMHILGLADAEAVNGPGMGNVYSLYGFIDRPLVRAGGFSFGYSAGLGFGLCFSKLYDPVSNPWNIIISTPVNGHFSLGLFADYAITSRYEAGLGFYFNHNSNGAITFPNKGLNAFELALTLGMKNERADSKAKRSVKEYEPFRSGFIFNVQASTGVMSNEARFDRTLEEAGRGENVRYFKYSFDVSALYRYSQAHATGLALDLFLTPFCSQIAAYDGRGETYQPVSVGLSIIHEMSYHNFSTTLNLGRYLYDNDGLARNKKLYQMVTVKYHFPALADSYVGFVLKAHKFKAAESFQFCIGKRF
ncbi:MAG: acyloxyacyl hydrolase [Bacteroidales bacterium]|nr:acyloxyacyl hydrolase [Bacteroidales bacterium]